MDTVRIIIFLHHRIFPYEKSGQFLSHPAFFSANSAIAKSLREIDTSTPAGVASPRLSALLFLFTGFLRRHPDNGRQSQPGVSLRVFSILQMVFLGGGNLKPKRRRYETQHNHRALTCLSRCFTSRGGNIFFRNSHSQIVKTL